MIKNPLDSIPEGSEDNIFVDSADFRDAALGRRDRRDLAVYYTIPESGTSER